MSNRKDKIEQRNKILKGLEKTWEKLVQSKKENKSDLILLKDDKIVHVKPA